MALFQSVNTDWAQRTAASSIAATGIYQAFLRPFALCIKFPEKFFCSAFSLSRREYLVAESASMASLEAI